MVPAGGIDDVIHGRIQFADSMRQAVEPDCVL